MKSKINKLIFKVKANLDNFMMESRENQRKTNTALNKKLNGEKVYNYQNLEMYS